MKRTVIPKTEKIYVKVNSDFDSTGYMQPRIIIWDDGRTFEIEQIRDFCPAACVDSSRNGDCYTVIIKGEEKHLFFEHLDTRFNGRIGRWFVERSTAQA